MKIREEEAVRMFSDLIPEGRPVDDAALVDEQRLTISLKIDNATGLLEFVAGPAASFESQAEPFDGKGIVRMQLNPLEPFRTYHGISVAKRIGIPPVALRRTTEFIRRSIRFFRQKDCLIMKMDPVIVDSQGNFELGGCQLEIDDDAAYRQGDLDSAVLNTETELEALARSQNITYVELAGEIAIISGGAGSTMSVVDLVHHFGGRPANFVDAMGGAGLETIRNLVKLVLDRAENDPSIKAILLAMHLSATPMKHIVEAFCEAFESQSPRQPIVGYLHAGGGALLNMTLDEAHDRLRSTGVRIYPELQEAIKAVVRLSHDG